MSLQPQIVEEVLALIERNPELTKTQRVILKMAAALLWQDELPSSVWSFQDDEIDSRLKISHGDDDEWELVPDRFEMTYGLLCPKEWATPNRLMKTEMWNTEFNALRESGMEHEAVMKLATQRVREKLLERQRAYSERRVKGRTSGS